MSGLNNQELDIMGYKQVYDYTQFSHDNHVNVIPEQSFHKLVTDTFKTIAGVMRETYGPYGSTVVISDQGQTTTTKDGYNVFSAMKFSHQYKHLVYQTIKNICERVNQNVGDGTTSCILLADKMFTKINERIKTSEDKRNILKVLSYIEKYLQDDGYIEGDKMAGVIHPLTTEALKRIIDLAGNYDSELTFNLMMALAPNAVEENGLDVVKSVRNVHIVDMVDAGKDSNVSYEIEHMPGDYRVRIEMDKMIAFDMQTKRQMNVAIYDHSFTTADWENFMAGYDNKTPTLILARSFSAVFHQQDYKKYEKTQLMMSKRPSVIIADIKSNNGSSVQDEIQDLCAILGVDKIGLNHGEIDHQNDLSSATISVFNGDALCFYDVKPPVEYIEKLKMELETNAVAKSRVKKTFLTERINALEMKISDTLIKVTAGTSLELKMVCDKITDCISIVNSAITNGIVNNMLLYGWKRMEMLSNRDHYESGIFEKQHDCSEELMTETLKAIQTSIEGLFEDVWVSKYGDDESSLKNCDATKKHFYGGDMSIDIVSGKMVNCEQLPTSTQYDIEVIVAAISIVKYLLTSRALIFDAHLLKMVGDQGHYQKM